MRPPALIALATLFVSGCPAPRVRQRPDAGLSVATVSAPRGGMYWGRWSDVPEGAWVSVWLDVTDGRVRGSWDLPPWHAELSGVVNPRGQLSLEWREDGVVAVQQSRTRAVTLTPDSHGALRGDGVELRPVGALDPGLREGMWLARWTGLPAGMAVETLMSRAPDGRWTAAYRYQGREGSFTGERSPDGALAIHWRELSPRDVIARGMGRLRPTVWGLRGTYGVDESEEGTGWWSIEPFAVGSGR